MVRRPLGLTCMQWGLSTSRDDWWMAHVGIICIQLNISSLMTREPIISFEKHSQFLCCVLQLPGKSSAGEQNNTGGNTTGGRNVLHRREIFLASFSQLLLFRKEENILKIVWVGLFPAGSYVGNLTGIIWTDMKASNFRHKLWEKSNACAWNYRQRQKVF